MMLKAANKNRLTNPNLLLLESKRNATTRRLIRGHGRIEDRRGSMADIQGKLKGNVGIVRMNREHRLNTLTPNFARQVKRGVETMYLDHTVNLIYLTTAEGQHFCNGTDFRTLLHYQANKEEDKAAKYLGDLYHLQASFAKINKPIMTVAPGHSFNSGAGLLAASGFPTICHDSVLSFNECTFGYVPHAGTTYYANNLKGDFGTFLVLTGIPFSGKDAIRLGIADSLIEIPETYEYEVSDIMESLDTRHMPDARTAGNQNHGGAGWKAEPELEAIERLKQMTRTLKDDHTELRRREGQWVHDEDFKDPRTRKPDVVARADLEYKRLLRNFNNSRIDPQKDTNYFRGEALTFNSFEYIYNYMRIHSGHIYNKDTHKSIVQHTQMIDRCFWPDSVEEILLLLRKETHPFAKDILQRMESNSMLSMKLALKMIRKSKNLAYGEILEMEKNVAMNKLKDKDFELGVKEILMKPSKRGQGNPGFSTDVPDSLVESYFQENARAARIDLDIVENSLLPTRHYFTKFPDSVRIYMNETPCPQEDVRDAADIEIREALRAEGIDLMQKTVTVPQAREYLTKKLKMDRKFQEQIRRAMQLVSDGKLRAHYYEGIDKELKKLGDANVFYDLINHKVQGIFEKAYVERLGKIYEKSKEAQSLEKRRMFIRFKKFLMQSRVLAYLGEETDRLSKQTAALPYKAPHLTENWTQGWREQEHPDIKRSFMWHLGKTIGRANLAPAEMMKTFLTDPAAAKTLSTFTFDKEALEKLQKDLLENPEKYEAIFLAEKEQDYYESQEYLDPVGKWESRHAKAYTREHWYRLINDGKKPHMESWPMKVEYHAYKQWADGIKHKALDSLKGTVARLLSDFKEDASVGNEVAQAPAGKNLDKKAALGRVLTLLNGAAKDVEFSSSELLAQSSDGGKRKARKLYDGKRALADVEEDFHKFIETDKELSSVFKTAGDAVQNPLIAGLRADLLSQLHQLVELVLLASTDPSNDSQEEMEKRLASLLGPQRQRERTASLKLVDDFLSDKTGKSTLKAAVEIVKPFFFGICQEKLEEEASKVLSGFNADEGGSREVLEYYLFSTSHPGELQNNAALEKLSPSHALGAQMNFLERAAGEDGLAFQNRMLLQDLGQHLDTAAPKASIEKRISKLMDNSKLEQRALYTFQNLGNDVAQALADEDDRHKQERLLRPRNDYFDDQEAEQMIEKAHLEDMDVQEITRLAAGYQDVQQYVENHEYEILSTMTSQDWLHIYSKAIKEQNLDMDQFARATQTPETYEANVEAGIGAIGRAAAITGVPEEHVEDFNWDHMADYAAYIKSLTDKGRQVTAGKHREKNLEKMLEFMAAYDNTKPAKKGGRNQVQRESIFRNLNKEIYDTQHTRSAEHSLKSEINSMRSLQGRVQENSKLAHDCYKLAQFAPKDARDRVEQLVKGGHKYVDLNALKDHLATGDYSKELDPKNFIDKDALLRDIQKGSALEDFMAQYKDSKVDVVSVAEIKSMLEAAVPTKNVDSQLLAQIKSVIEHVDDQLQYVSHERRQEITLGEFMTRHHYLNGTSLREYSNELLRGQIEKALGRAESPEDSAAAVDWNLSGVLTHPASHAEGLLGESSQELVEVVDEETGLTKTKTAGELLQQAVYRDARRLTELSPEMTSLKNMYENSLMIEYTRDDLDQKKVQNLIQGYTEARMKDCQLSPDFAQGLQSPNGSIYLKVLRECITNELKLAESTTGDEFSWTKTADAGNRNLLQYDTEWKYSLNHLNNEEAIGYRNLEARASDVANNKDIAHETVFDKMLADYFLQKRGDTKNSNKLIEDLEVFFDKNLTSPDGTPIDQTNRVIPVKPEGTNALGFQYARQSANKDGQPELLPFNFPALMDLDLAVNKQLYNGKGGLSKALQGIEDGEENIPEFFDEHDVRKPADVYVQGKLDAILEELFEARRALEKFLSRGELVAYDKVLARYLKHDVLYEKLKREIYKDYNELEQVNQVASHALDEKTSMEKQMLKTTNRQPEFNKGVVNEDAFFKFLAYSGNLHKKRAEDPKATHGDLEASAGYHRFESYYQETLLNDAKEPARPIDPSVFDAKARAPQLSGSDRQDAGFLDMRGRREQFQDERLEYKENKLEQQDRMELFYVLEQFFESSRKNPATDENDPLNKAQQHMQDYFSQPENTYFFDKNKIR